MVNLNKMMEISRRSAIASEILIKKRTIAIKGGKAYMKSWKRRKAFVAAKKVRGFKGKTIKPQKIKKEEAIKLWLPRRIP